MKNIRLVTNHHPLSTSYGAGRRINQIWTSLKTICTTDVVWLTESNKDAIHRHEVERDHFTQNETRPVGLPYHRWNALSSRKIKTAFQIDFDLNDYEIIVSRYITSPAKLGLNLFRQNATDPVKCSLRIKHKRAAPR